MVVCGHTSTSTLTYMVQVCHVHECTHCTVPMHPGKQWCDGMCVMPLCHTRNHFSHACAIGVHGMCDGAWDCVKNCVMCAMAKIQVTHHRLHPSLIPTAPLNEHITQNITRTPLHTMHRLLHPYRKSWRKVITGSNDTVCYNLHPTYCTCFPGQWLVQSLAGKIPPLYTAPLHSFTRWCISISMCRLQFPSAVKFLC